MGNHGLTGAPVIRGTLLAVVVIAGTGSAALGAAPANDDRGAATVVTDVPYEDSRDTTDATAQENDLDCFDLGGSPTVWYSFTPQNDRAFVATTAGSDYDTTLTLATPGPGGLEIIDCNDDDDLTGDLSSRIGWAAAAGQEYLLMVGSYSGDGGDLRFAIRRALPPPSLDLRIYRSGTVNRRGGAQVRGVLRCEGGRDWSLEVNGRQDMGRRILRGFAGRVVECGEPWAVRISPGEFRFVPGFLVVRAAVEWCSDLDCGVERARRAVRLH